MSEKQNSSEHSTVISILINHDIPNSTSPYLTAETKTKLQDLLTFVGRDLKTEEKGEAWNAVNTVVESLIPGSGDSLERFITLATRESHLGGIASHFDDIDVNNELIKIAVSKLKDNFKVNKIFFSSDGFFAVSLPQGNAFILQMADPNNQEELAIPFIRFIRNGRSAWSGYQVEGKDDRGLNLYSATGLSPGPMGLNFINTIKSQLSDFT